ncbi:DUF1345 domain-containing protein [Hymenobacter sp. BT730]|uniref:DUF1345 domain-containing protein n=1 Tax=Hymenobacter sp. BT730 TaxID=3063332 RepID=UPI0026E10459|nr:DUF1345 domain-containing protein [Hymenobacter sp. BT730]
MANLRRHSVFSTYIVHHLGALPTLVRIALACVLAVATFLLLQHQPHLTTRLLAAWNAFAFTCLVLIWSAVFTAEPDHIRKVAVAEDPGRTLLFVFALIGILASLVAVVVLLRAMRSLPPDLLRTSVVLSIMAVAFAWMLLHTLFTLHYAHLYYAPADLGKEGGLQFPGHTPDPNYLDFAYFSFTIGMTAQTADIGISSPLIRRLVLVHALLSFVFNTALVAMTISGLASTL